MKKILLIIFMGVMLCGCSCSKDNVKCPDDGNKNTEEVKTIISNDYTELYKKTVSSVVKIGIKNKETRRVNYQGSGVVVFEEGNYAYVVTNYHVISGLTTSLEIEVYFSNSDGSQSGKSEIATLMGSDSKEDVAVLRINKSDKYKVAVIGNSDNVESGEFVYTIGSPADYFNVTTAGYIISNNILTKYDIKNTGVPVDVYELTFNAAISPGNSGGALFNSKGELIGITTYNHTDITYFYSALPINFFMKVARYVLAEGKEYVRPILNISTISVNSLGTDKDLYGISSDIYTGVYVRESRESSISVQSIIVAINGKEIKSTNDLGKELLKYNVGDTIKVTTRYKTGVGETTVDVVLHS